MKKTSKVMVMLVAVIALLLPKICCKAERIVEPEDSYAIITSFGDTLCHKPLFNAAYDEETENYEFSPMFKYVEKYFEDSTVTIGNLEFSMAGPERGYSGYPCFNAPEHLATDLKELGADIMTTSNNHSLDKGFSGIESTLNYLDIAGIKHTGTSRDEEEQNTILFNYLNGIKTAFLSYTYGTNGIAVPEGKEFCVNLIDEELMLKHINKAKREGAELIVVSMHWGVEYQTTENKEQERLAKILIQNDVDIILGSHPHVLQPMKMVKVKTEEGEEKEGLVIFSQGNFFSNQRDINTRNTAIFRIEVKKDGETKEVTVENVSYVPLYMGIKAPGTEDRYELLDLNEIIRSYEAGEDTWSEEMYNLSIRERERCINLIGPEISRNVNVETIESDADETAMIEAFLFGKSLLFIYYPIISNNSNIIRNIFQNSTISTNFNIISNLYRTKYL